jgi:hypothetical protein
MMAAAVSGPREWCRGPETGPKEEPGSIVQPGYRSTSWGPEIGPKEEPGIVQPGYRSTRTQSPLHEQITKVSAPVEDGDDADTAGDHAIHETVGTYLELAEALDADLDELGYSPATVGKGDEGARGRQELLANGLGERWRLGRSQVVEDCLEV